MQTYYRVLGETTILSSGWKPVSMVDVYQRVTFTLWTCGCNLKCPFCHNWRLAVNDPSVCRRIEISSILEELESARILVDYIHITGGEPLVQHKAIEALLRTVKENIGVMTSLNTNFTIHQPLARMINEGIIDHVATDAKIPPTLLYGYPLDIAETLWRLYKKTLKLITDTGTPLELRIPVPRNIDWKTYTRYLEELLSILNGHNTFYVIVQPLVGPPITDPRDREWCRKYCDPPKTVLEKIAETLRSHGVENIVVRDSLAFET